MLLLVLALAAIPLSTTAQQGGRTTYVYDSNGRLHAVVSPNGDAAIYEYDAAGNLVSISRGLYTTVSIVEFDPTAGTAGTTVNIYGTAFSPVANQNVVAFNGVATVVQAASATQLVTSVPDGATTGPISVTTPNGTVLSSTPFVIGGAPTITSFAPTIGAPGDTFTVTGTNFSTVPADDQLKINGVLANSVSSTLTDLVAGVPVGATSGRLSISTPGGSSQSSDDFFVPPPPYTAASVDDTRRMAIGGSRMVNINNPGHLGLVVFDATAGQTISLQLSDQSVEGYISIFKPDGTVALDPVWLGQSFIDAFTLTSAGTYTIMVRAEDWSNGSVTVALNDSAEITGSIVAGGAPVTVSITSPGRNERLSFDGVAGQRVFLNATDVSMSTTTHVTLFGPDGTPITAAEMSFNPALNFLDTLALPVTGRYSILIDPEGEGIGNLTLTLYNVPANFQAQLQPDGPTATASVSVPGQNAQLTFSATAGQRMAMRATNSTINQFTIAIINPDGSHGNSFTNTGFLETGFLPATGTYTVLVDPFGAYIGNISISLISVPDDVTSAINMDGAPVTLTTTAPGQNAVFTFSATAGQKVSAKVTAMTFGAPTGYQLRKPDGTIIFSTQLFTSTAFIDAQLLPVTGTYSIVLDPSGEHVGSVTVKLFDASDVVRTLVVDGPSASATIVNPGQAAVFNFDGTPGQWLRLTKNSTTIPDPNSAPTVFQVFNPDGTFLASIPRGSTLLDMPPLASNGTYRVLVDPGQENVGSVTLTLSSAPAATPIQIDGPSVTVSVSPAGRRPRLTFTGTAGQSVSLFPSNVSLFNPQMTIYRDDGTVVAANAFNTNAFIESAQLPVTGTYSIGVSSFFNGGTGNITLTLSDVTEITGAITQNGPAVTVTCSRPGQNTKLTFSGTAGERVNFFVNNDTISNTSVSLLKSDGTRVFGPFFFNTNGVFIEGIELPDTDTYGLLVDPEFASTGSLQIKLMDSPADATGTVTIDGSPAAISTSQMGQNMVASLNGTANQQININLNFDASLAARCEVITLAAPDGSEVTSTVTCSANTAVLGPVTLPATGTYLLKIDPDFTQMGTATITVTTAPP